MHTFLSSYLWPGLRALRRDWRSGELRLLLLALILAVSAVTAVGFLADRLDRALQRDSGQLLGGDLAIDADAPIPPEFLQEAAERRLQTVQTLQFPSMASSGDNTQLVALKAVTDLYPLRGELRVAESANGPPVTAAHGPLAGEAWVDGQLLNLLGLKVGDRMAVGDTHLKIGRIIAYEPDRGMRFINVAPRLLMRVDDLPATGLVAPGSRIRYQLLAAGEAGDIDRFRSWVQPRLERGQRISTLESSRPEIQRTLARAQNFLLLVAMLTVVIAAVAIALAARRFGQRHHDGVAIMRCLGARTRQLSAMLWIEFIVLGLMAGVVGCVAGFLAHQGLVAIVSEWLKTSLPNAGPLPALQGLAAGLLLLLGFALPPLAGLPRVAPVRVLRRDAALSPAKHGPAYLMGAASFLLLLWWMSGDLKLSFIVGGGFLVSVLVFAALAWGLLRILDAARKRLAGSPSLRFALAGMARRRGLTITQLCALSMGLMILLLLALTRNDLLRGWQSTLPPDAPNTFVINIQPDQREAVVETLSAAGIPDVVLSPMVRGRLVAINQQPVDADHYEDDRAKRMVDREFNLSHAQALPASNRITEGRWLDPRRSELALESGLAQTLGVGVGDTMTFDVAGQSIEATVSGLRKVNWDSFEANFFALLSPAALRDAPATFITSIHVEPGRHGDLAQRLLQQFPNLTLFDIGAILGQVEHILDRAVQAVQFLFIFAVLAGALVLGASLFSTRDERMHEVAVLRALGASGRQLKQALRVELSIIGIMAGLMAAFAAVAIAALLARHVFDFPLGIPWWPWVAGMAAGLAISLAGGSAALAGVLKTSPLASLRVVS
ncbi:FtsX-like permease family protein [Alcaligenaceae bacterium]|nr:FtsX-like permease family protein [Alcaligenaceae bacterium]